MLTRIKRLLKTLQYRWSIPAYRRVEKSGLFDPDYYLEKNPDVAASAIDPLLHYVTIGFVEGRQPGPLFDLAYYLHQAPTLTKKTDIPLLHFLQKGRYCGFIPNPLVDLEYYSWKNPHIDFSKLDPFSHFLRKGGKTGSGCSPSPYFDPAFYCNLYPDAAKYTDNPRAAYEHFLKVGLPESRRPSVYFDIAWYLDKTPILHELGFNPINHYFYIGRGERKSPSPLFDPLYYAKIYGLEQCNDLFAHYLRCELIEDRRPCSWFDPGFYRETYLAGQQERVSPLKHFLERGLANRLYPNRKVEQLPEKPVISIVVPVYNVEIAHLNTCIRSVLYQSYPHWQLCLADDCSTDRKIRPLLTEWAAVDSRIKVVFLTENSGISAATNGAAGLADGNWLAFLDNDDELTQDALQVFVERINSDPGDLYYSDEDLIGADGRQFSVFRKPGFNRELLLCHNYVTHCVVAKKALYEKVGGCAGEHNGAQDLDLFLKLSEQAEKIIHIPRVLYHWRASAASTSINHDQKTYADEAGRKSIANALVRRGISAEVLFTDLKFYYRAKRTVRPGLSVTLVIYCNRNRETLVPWLTGLRAAAGYRIAQLIALATKPALGALIDTFGNAAGIDTAWHLVSEDLGPAQAFDAVQKDIKGELVAFIGDDSANLGDGWLSALVEYGQLPDIGMVGGRIEYPADHPDTVTPIPDCRISSPGYYARFLTDCSVLMNGPHCPQEVLYVNGALCLTSRAALHAVGGLNGTAFPHLFAFHDLCCRLRQQGRKNVYTPYCRATIATDGGRGQMQGLATALQEEQNRFREKWFDLLAQGDPFYNPGIFADHGGSVEEFRTWLTGNRSKYHP